MILGRFGNTSSPAQKIEDEMVPTDTDFIIETLAEADSIVIVLGYDMAVGQVQQSVFELTKRLRNKGKNVRFTIHPVAVRLLGKIS